MDFWEKKDPVINFEKFLIKEKIINSDIIQNIKDEILEATQMFMASNAPRAAMAMVGGIVDPTELGIRDKMSAAKDLLDRAGLVKTEKMQVESTGGVMLLPPKNDTEEDE